MSAALSWRSRGASSSPLGGPEHQLLVGVAVLAEAVPVEAELPDEEVADDLAAEVLQRDSPFGPSPAKLGGGDREVTGERGERRVFGILGGVHAKDGHARPRDLFPFGVEAAHCRVGEH